MAHLKDERTLVIIKPDGIQRSLIGDIVSRYERVGLKLVGMKMFVPNEDKVEQHYLLDPNWKKAVGEKAIDSYKKKGMEPPSSDPLEVGDRVLKGLKSYLVAGPVVAMVWQGAHAVEVVRNTMGTTNPTQAGPGTVRGDLGLTIGMNLIHGSDSPESAKREIEIFFQTGEIVAYGRDVDAWIIES